MCLCSNTCGRCLRVPSPLVGEGQGGGYVSKPRLRCLPDHCYDAFQILHHVVIGESKHCVSLRGKPSITPSIELLTRVEVVCLSIEFDHDTRRMADEISDVVADRDLAADTKSTDSMRFQVSPKQGLGARHRPAKRPRATALSIAARECPQTPFIFFAADPPGQRAGRALPEGASRYVSRSDAAGLTEAVRNLLKTRPKSNWG